MDTASTAAPSIDTKNVDATTSVHSKRVEDLSSLTRDGATFHCEPLDADTAVVSWLKVEPSPSGTEEGLSLISVKVPALFEDKTSLAKASRNKAFTEAREGKTASQAKNAGSLNYLMSCLNKKESSSLSLEYWMGEFMEKYGRNPAVVRTTLASEESLTSLDVRAKLPWFDSVLATSRKRGAEELEEDNSVPPSADLQEIRPPSASPSPLNRPPPSVRRETAERTGGLIQTIFPAWTTWADWRATTRIGKCLEISSAMFDAVQRCAGTDDQRKVVAVKWLKEITEGLQIRNGAQTQSGQDMPALLDATAQTITSIVVQATGQTPTQVYPLRGDVHGNVKDLLGKLKRAEAVARVASSMS